MLPKITEQTAELAQLCEKYSVSRLDLFDDAENFPPEENALNFLVKFRPLPLGYYADAYFGLLESLEQLFGCPVKLVSDKAIKNPYFRQSVEETRKPIYAADD